MNNLLTNLQGLVVKHKVESDRYIEVLREVNIMIDKISPKNPEQIRVATNISEILHSL